MQLMVVGMHRSGTSMLARLLNLMGVYFAPEGTGTGANRENPKGFWERRDVRALNDFVLHSAGCDWNRVSAFDVQRIPPGVLEEFHARASKIVLEMDANRPWFLKEPRLCLLMPLWLRVLEVPVCVHILRHPVEVASSLRTRNQMPMDAGLALWEVYNRSARESMRGLPQVLVVHRDLLRDPVPTVAGLHRQLEALGIRRLTLPAREEVEAFISTDLYREREGAAGLAGFAEVAQVRLFEAWREDSQVVEPSGLSPEARQALVVYEESLPPLPAPTSAADKASAEAELRSKVSAAERQAQALKVQEQQAQALLKEKIQQLGFLEREFASMREMFASRESAASELLLGINKLLEEQAVRAQMEKELKRLGSELARSREEVASLQREMSEARQSSAKEQQARMRLVSELEASKQAAMGVAEARDTLQSRIAKQSEEMVSLTRLILDTNAALGSAASELETLRQEHAAYVSQQEERAAANASALREELERKLGSCLSQHAQELSVVERRRVELESELARRDHRISALLDAARVCGTELDRLDRGLRSAQESSSWRLTAPLRRIMSLVRGARPDTAVNACLDQLRQSPWFDADWYASQHPELAAGGMSAEVHYLVRGAADGANPSARFDTRYYLEQNPDVASSGQNPLLHFIQFGEAEGRLPAPDAGTR